MATHLNPLREAVSRLDGVWTDAGDASGLDRARLVRVNDALGSLARVVDGLRAEVAARIAFESRAELGAESLAKQQGFRNPVQLIAATTGSSSGEASRLVAVGVATAPRTDLLGGPLPARYPVVQQALRSGTLGTAAAGLIVALLERVRLKAGIAIVAEAEVVLVERAVGLSLDEVRKVLTRAEAHLDPDGVAPRGEQARANRSLTMFERDGMLHLNAVLDAETAAPVRAAVQGYVSAVFATRAKTIAPDAVDADRRTIPQLQADALSEFCAHMIGCDTTTPALAGATVIVRMNLTDLTDAGKAAKVEAGGVGAGFATIDGTDQPIDISAARRMAASGGVIPAVLGTDSEILDWGREKRFFTRAQRQALAERDGGCAMCTLPPSMTRAHHIDWWERDQGRTDLNRGVLLCESCHHRVHDNGWGIRIDGVGVAAQVWFIPPPYVDPDRTPRLGGLARYTLAA